MAPHRGGCQAGTGLHFVIGRRSVGTSGSRAQRIVKAVVDDVAELFHSFFYKLLKEGKGPKIAKLGRCTIITRDAAADWRASLEKGA